MLASLSNLLVPVGLGEEALAAPGALQQVGKGVRRVAASTVPRTPEQKRKDALVGAGVVGAAAGVYLLLRSRQAAASAQQAQQAQQAAAGAGGAASSGAAPGSVPTLPPGPPAQPLQPSVSQVTSSSASLVLSQVAGAGEYEVLDAATGAVLTPGILDVTQPVTITGLLPQTTYSFSEVAINQAGQSPPSVPVNVTTLGQGQAASPAGQNPQAPPTCPAGYQAVFVPSYGWTCQLPAGPTLQNPIVYVAGKGFDYPPPAGTYPVIDPSTGTQTGTVTVGSGGTVTSTTGSGGPPVGSAPVVAGTTPPATTTTTTTTTTTKPPTTTTTTSPAPAPSQPPPGSVPIRNGAGRIIGYARPGGPAVFGSNSGLTIAQQNALNAAQNPYLSDLQRAEALQFALRNGGLTRAQIRAFQNTNVPLTQTVVQAILQGVGVTGTTLALAQTAASQGRRLTPQQQTALRRAEVQAGNAPPVPAAAPTPTTAPRPQAPASSAAARLAASAVAAAGGSAVAQRAAAALAASQAPATSAAVGQVATQARQAAQTAAAAVAASPTQAATLAQQVALAAQQAAQRQAAQQQAAQALAAQEAAAAQRAAAAQAAAQAAQSAAAQRAAALALAAAAQARAQAQRQEQQNVLAQGAIGAHNTAGVAAPTTTRATQPPAVVQRQAAKAVIRRTSPTVAVVQGTRLRLVGA